MCNKMHKFFIATAAGLMASTAMAYDGKIEFTGEITAASCNIAGGNGADVGGSKGSQIINVKLGKVSIDSLAGAGSGTIAAGTAINLNLDCGATAAGLTQVKVAFDPAAGSGVDSKNNSLLKIADGAGAAKGVGIGIYKAGNANELLNLGGNETFNAPLVDTSGGEGTAQYTANLALRAAYVANGDGLPTAGVANGTLPFTLTYE